MPSIVAPDSASEQSPDEPAGVTPDQGAVADLTDALAGWRREPGGVQARSFVGRDGRRKLQVRIDLGILQMEAEGRPDGERPGGFESLLHGEYDRLTRRLEVDAAPSRPRLPAEICAALRAEALLYHQRAMAAFALGDFVAVLRDTRRNVEAIEFCRRYADRPADRELLEHLRPPSLLLRARAEAAAALEARSHGDALDAIERGLADLHESFLLRGDPAGFERASETYALRRMREVLLPRLPASQRSELEERLRAALLAENYALAAILRDELRQLG